MADLAFDRYAAPKPTGYHHAVAQILMRRDPEAWRFFASEGASRKAAEALRFELLKRTYRLERDSHPAVYAAADEIAEAMGLRVPVTLYQAETADAVARNAALYFEPEAAHVLFEGDALRALDGAELRFVLGHELAHHALWTAESGKFWTAYRLLRWAAAEAGAAPVFAETARLERLHTEVFADRYGLWAVGDLEPALRAHVKIATGADEVSGAAYLAQAETVLAEAEARAAVVDGAALRSDGRTHPEGYLRAALLAAWARQPAAAEGAARRWLEGAPPLDRLDLVAQERLDDLTHWMLYEFLTEPWIGRDLVRAHAAEISPRLVGELAGPRGEPDDLDRLRAAIAGAAPSVQAYLAYLLLDFATVDPQIDDVMLAAALRFSEDFGLLETFRAVAAQELKTTRAKLAEIERQATDILARAEIALGAFAGPETAASTATGGAA